MLFRSLATMWRSQCCKRRSGGSLEGPFSEFDFFAESDRRSLDNERDLSESATLVPMAVPSNNLSSVPLMINLPSLFLPMSPPDQASGISNSLVFNESFVMPGFAFHSTSQMNGTFCKLFSLKLNVIISLPAIVMRTQ